MAKRREKSPLTIAERKAHVTALLTFFQGRGISPDDASEIMAITLVCLAGDRQTLEIYCEELLEDWDYNNGAGVVRS